MVGLPLSNKLRDPGGCWKLYHTCLYTIWLTVSWFMNSNYFKGWGKVKKALVLTFWGLWEKQLFTWS